MRYQKLSPGLITALENAEGGNPLLAVLLRCTPEEDFSSLAPAIWVNQLSGRIRTAQVRAGEVEALVDHPAVHSVALSRVLKPSLDIALPYLGLPHRGEGADRVGEGVAIGVVDTGIDGSHAAFQGRIARVWDQTAAGSGVGRYRYGSEVAGAEVCGARDEEGHGTHIAGIAAGRHAVYGGVAPGATLICVKTDFSHSRVADGIRYVFDVARELKLPAVVNLSCSGQVDPHDGTDELCELIDEVSGPGRIVCCAAGNEGKHDIHAHAAIRSGDTVAFDFQVCGGSKTVVLEAWFGPEDEMEAAIRDPAGRSTGFQGPLGTGNPARGYQLGANSIRINTERSAQANGDRRIHVEISGEEGQEIASGVWALVLRAEDIHSGLVDVWCEVAGGTPARFLSHVCHNVKIGSPGAAASAVTVAAFNTRARWNDREGLPRLTNFAVNEHSAFSNRGPLRNRRPKPDLACPGAMIVSALSSSAQLNPACVVDGEFCLMNGTSMAAPMATGLVALMLQANPQLTPEEAKDRLRSVCTIPGAAPGQFDPAWGFGIPDASALDN